jgi:hypothetical protein
MKDYLHKAVWWNRETNNPTQNAYRRFQRVPWGERPDVFAESRDKLNASKNRLNEIREELFHDRLH